MKKPNHIYSYAAFRDLVKDCAMKGTTTGEITPERIAATTLNAARMNRIEKQSIIGSALIAEVMHLSGQYTWMILAEAWCGDGAQTIPVIARIASYNPNIKVQIILRDENPEIMDQFLTNGGRAIPKLICIEDRTEKVVATWGPRPTAIQERVKQYKKEFPAASHDEFVKELHTWYAHDKTQAIQNDFLELLKTCHTVTI